MRTNTITGITANFMIETQINVKLSWDTIPVDEREKMARDNFHKDLQELADFINSTLAPELLTMWQNVQKAKSANGN